MDTVQAEIESLSAELADRYEEITLLYDLGETLSRLGDERAICCHVLAEAVRVIGGDRSGVFLTDDVTGEASLVAQRNLGGAAEDLKVASGDGVVGSAAESGRPIIARTDQEVTEAVRLGAGGSWADRAVASPPLLAVPLRAGGATHGVLLLTGKASGGVYLSRDLKLAQAIASQAALFIENSRQARRAREAERLRREVEIARSIQGSLLPRRERAIPGLDVAGLCRSASDVGGDYFGYFDPLPGLTGVALVDVSGHSVAAAVNLATIRGVLRCETAGRRSTREVVERVNHLVHRDLEEGGMYATLFYGLFDHRTRDFAYTSAGQPAALLLRPGDDRCRKLATAGAGVGVEDQESYKEDLIRLAAGDVLLLYSDGLPDARDAAGSFFGEARAARALLRARHGSAWEIISSILGEVSAFTGDAPQIDDTTLVLLKVPSAAPGER